MSITLARRPLATLTVCTLLVGGALVIAPPARAAGPARLAARLVTSLNAIRKQHHLVPLTADPVLTRQAATHSVLMVRHGRRASRFSGEKALSTRLTAAGYRPKAAAQVVGSASTQRALLRKPQGMQLHRAARTALLSRTYTAVGVAVRYSARKHRYWLTIVFARPAPPTTAQREAAQARSVLSALNRERAAHGRTALRMNSTLIRSAHSHNLAMARADSMSHQLPGELYFATRILRAGYDYRFAAENIGWNSVPTLAGVLQLQTMMYGEKPPDGGHRQNILSTRYRDIGVDVYLDPVHHKLWLTEDFGER